MNVTPEMSLVQLRRDAKALARLCGSGDRSASRRAAVVLGKRDADTLKHADYLHVIAKENGFASWPMLKTAVELHGLTRAERLQRLRMALLNNKPELAASLLEQEPDLPRDNFELLLLTYDQEALAHLAKKPRLARVKNGGFRPLVALAFSCAHRVFDGRGETALRLAQALVDAGADVNDGYQMPGTGHALSALYGAIGHSGHLALGQWLLDHGADPNDGESLYHATELGHLDGLKMLLAAGAKPNGTNALYRAMDFHDHAAVEMLLAHGADPDDYSGVMVAGEAPWVIRGLHQAARRGCDRRMAELLLNAGADPNQTHAAVHPYVYAQVYGNSDVAQALSDRGATAPLGAAEQLLADVAKGSVGEGVYLDPAKIPAAFQDLLCELAGEEGRDEHIRRLVDVGFPYDKPDSQGLPPVQVAGWNGMPERLKYFLRLMPDLSRVNGYGGTLLSTILHGAENCPKAEERDHIACLELVLIEGLALPKSDIAASGRSDIRAFLQDWAERYPSQVV